MHFSFTRHWPFFFVCLNFRWGRNCRMEAHRWHLRVITGIGKLCRLCSSTLPTRTLRPSDFPALPSAFISVCCREGITPLMLCAREPADWKIGKDLVKVLFFQLDGETPLPRQAGCSLNASSPTSPSSLYLCAQHGNLNLLELLCFAKADVNERFKVQIVSSRRAGIPDRSYSLGCRANGLRFTSQLKTVSCASASR